jgi:hypothetical protein
MEIFLGWQRAWAFALFGLHLKTSVIASGLHKCSWPPHPRERLRGNSGWAKAKTPARATFQ